MLEDLEHQARAIPEGLEHLILAAILAAAVVVPEA
jgi:hypothetical protein